MKLFKIFTLVLMLLAGEFSFAQTDATTKTIPFADLGMNFPLNLVVPNDYVYVKRFRDLGIIVLCAVEDEAELKSNGDFSSAKRAVITIRPSPSDYYDPNRKSFSFESQETRDSVRSAGGTNFQIVKREVRGVPTAAMTFEVGDRKLYALALAAGPSLVRLSYNARSASRSVDDHAWNALVEGL